MSRPTQASCAAGIGLILNQVSLMQDAAILRKSVRFATPAPHLGSTQNSNLTSARRATLNLLNKCPEVAQEILSPRDAHLHCNAAAAALQCQLELQALAGRIKLVPGP